MNGLAFDLSNFVSSFAVMKDGTVVDQHTSDVFRGQDITLLSSLKAMLGGQGLSFQDLDVVVATRGPGSFTGIRVALATLQGLGLASNVPILAIDSFSFVLNGFLQKNPDHAKPILILLKSMRQELYGQFYGSDLGKVGEPFMKPPSEILENIHHHNLKEMTVMGNGEEDFKHNLEEFLNTAPVDITFEDYMPTAADLLLFAKALPQDQWQQFPADPLYIREADITKAKPLFGQK